MYKLKYLPSFDADLIEAETYLYEHSPAACDKLTEAVMEKTANLVEHPFMYPISVYDNSLRLIVLPYQYLLFYRVNEIDQVIEIYRILRGMRDIPNILYLTQPP